MYKKKYGNRIFKLLTISLMSLVILSGCSNNEELLDKEVKVNPPIVVDVEDIENMESIERLG